MSANRKAQTQVEGRRIEAIYEDYQNGHYQVNRRYQRKLVWSLGQKRQLIDSILSNIPIPLVLLAKSERGDASFEIIDGLQRINAIVSFIENKFSYNGEYFNLESLGLTKYLMDEGRLQQAIPKMSREESLKIAQYMIPVSTYSSEASSLVDETFRRINSSGRKLGMQEVRQAGSTSKIADLVRSISAEIRGDISRSDVIPLGEMTKISLRWRDEGDGPGIPVDEVFWIREGILRRDDLRSSKDEQLVLDLLVDILLNGAEDTSTEIRDDVYDPDSQVGKKIISALAGVSESDTLPVRFKRVLELMSKIGEAGSSNSWTRHTGKSTNNPTARYFHIAFRGFYTLMFEQNMEVADLAYVAKSTEGYWKKKNLDLGGTWKASSRKNQVNQFIGAIQNGFREASSPEVTVARQDLERLKRDYLRYANENRFYELKQGFTDLAEKKIGQRQPMAERQTFFERLIKTATAMANTAPESAGVIYIGISDSPATSAKVKERYGIEPLEFGDAANGLPNDIIGIEHELPVLGVDIDGLMLQLSTWIKETGSLDAGAEEFRRSLNEGLRTIRVRSSEGLFRTIVALHVKSDSSPVQYKGKFWERVGSMNRDLSAKDSEIAQQALFDRYEQFRYRAQ